MIIDFHTHLHAPGMSQEDRLHITTETVIEAARNNGVDITCISNPLHDLRRMDRAQGLAEVKTLHAGFAKARDQYKTELIAFVTAVPWSGEEYLREVERAVRRMFARSELRLAMAHFRDVARAIRRARLLHGVRRIAAAALSPAAQDRFVRKGENSCRLAVEPRSARRSRPSSPPRTSPVKCTAPEACATRGARRD